MHPTFFAIVALAALIGSNAQDALSLKKFPFRSKDCSLNGNEPRVKCRNNFDCTLSCSSPNDVECIGCPECPDSVGVDGTCFPKGTIAVLCKQPSFDDPGCTRPTPPTPSPPKCTKNSNQRCVNDAQCRIQCGDASFQCKKCPDNGCPGREFGTCLPKDELIFCTQEACIIPSRPPIGTPIVPMPPVPSPPSKCERGGCSGELCANEPLASPCIFKPEFACYRDAKCGNFGPGGKCGFKQTPELIKCLFTKKNQGRLGD